jgi:hypothetical protein
MASAAVEQKAEQKKKLVVSEMRISLLEKDLEGKHKERHTKHIAVVITDPALCASIQALIEPALVCPCKDAKTGKFTEKCKLCEGKGVPTLDLLPDAHSQEIAARDDDDPNYVAASESYPAASSRGARVRPVRPDTRVIADDAVHGEVFDKNPNQVRPGARPIRDEKQHGATFEVDDNLRIKRQQAEAAAEGVEERQAERDAAIEADKKPSQYP